MKKPLIKCSAIAATAALAIGLAAPAALAAAPKSTTVAAPIATANSSTMKMPTITAGQWRAVARQATKAGNLEVAQDALAMASRTEQKAKSGNSNDVQARGWIGVGKKALVWALRNGAQWIPAKFRPYAFKLAAALERITVTTQSKLTFAFQAVGVPYHISKDAAYWIVVFIL